MDLTDRWRAVARPRRDRGATLLEVVTVILILGLLLGVAVPTVLGGRQRAQDVEARSSLRTATTAAITSSDIRSDFRRATATDLLIVDATLTYVDGSTASTGPGVVSVHAVERDRWVGVVRSDSGTCFAVVIGNGGQTTPTADACAASDVTTPAPTARIEVIDHEGALIADTDGMCLVVVGGFLEQQPCSGSDPLLVIKTAQDGYSTLSVSNGYCFGTEGPFRAARVLEEACVHSDDQLWEIIPSFEDTVQFRNKETGYCLDVYGASSSAGADLIQWGYGDPPNATCKSTTEANNHNFAFG